MDARNVVPVRVAAAGRNNIRDLLREFLTEIPFVTEHPYLSPNEAEVYYFFFIIIEVFWIGFVTVLIFLRLLIGKLLSSVLFGILIPGKLPEAVPDWLNLAI